MIKSRSRWIDSVVAKVLGTSASNYSVTTTAQTKIVNIKNL
jgi:hypothetical protein